jgi:hypothetical protein
MRDRVASGSAMAMAASAVAARASAAGRFVDRGRTSRSQITMNRQLRVRAAAAPACDIGKRRETTSSVGALSVNCRI